MMNSKPSPPDLPFEPRASVERATGSQILRQLGVIAIVLVVWTGLLVGYVSLTGGPAETAAVDTPSPTATVAPPTEGTVPPTSEAAQPEPTPTPSPEVEESTLPSTVSFSQDVLPIFESRCFQCHGPSRTEGGLVLTDYQAVLAGSSDGPVIEPGSADDSVLVDLIVSGEMPRRGPNLLPGEIEAIIEWINAGAPDN
jgi:hypothetical protein